jgi:agmatine/peptidylarginine deiminase
MNKALFLFFLFILIVSILASETIRLNDGNNSIQVLSSTETETILQYNITTFDKARVEINGREYFHISLPEEGITQDKGYPELPVFNRSIIISNTARMSFEVYDVRYVDMELPVSPSRGVIMRDKNPADIPFEFGRIYESREFYPANLAGLSEPYILRDFRGMTVKTMPFAYNPYTRTLRMYTQYKIRVYADGQDLVNTLPESERVLSRDFTPIYENHFINWENYRYTPVNDSFGKLIVICHTNYLTQIAPYVNWKKQKGINTELVQWSTIGTTAAQLQTYIQNRYNADNTIAYIQIVGDAPQIPTLSSGGGGSDPTFSLVAGTDNYPDVFIGRFSAESAADVTAQVNKVITYERDLTTSATWLTRAMGLASAEGGGGAGDNGESDIAHMNLIRTDLLADGYTSVDQIYDPGAAAATVTTNVNAGRGFINYVGHGSDTTWGTTGFSNANASALTNGTMTPFIMDVACVNGNFVSITCFAEAWLRNANGGAIAMYASSINQSWNSPMRAEDECTDLLAAESKTTAGGLYYNSSCLMMDVYGNTASSDGVNMFKTWHIFGDASLLVRSKTPIAMSVTHPAQITIGTATVSVSTGVTNTLIAMTYNNTIYARGYTNSSGNATLTLVGAPSTAITYTITATAFNRVTYISSIQQIAGTGPYVNVTAATYVDSNNNVAEYNETGRFNITYQNVGSVVATSIVTTLTCTTPGITITDNTETIATLAAGASTTVNNAYTFNIANNIANGTSAAFTITMVSGVDTWTHNFTLTINAPALGFGSVTIQDTGGNNNGRLDPGETVTVLMPLNNTGAAASPSGSGTLSCATPGITVNTGTANFTAISAAGNASLSFSVSASPSVSVGTVASLVFNATAGAYTANKTESIGVGTPMSVILGAGTGTTPTAEGAPINIWYKSLHGQSVYTAAELSAAGVTGPINITQLGFYISTVPNLALPNFIIRMKHTTEANAANWQTATDMVTVYSNASYLPVVGGYQMLTLTAPFTWNGTGNIVIDTAFGLVSAYSETGTVQYTSVTNGYRYVRNDTADQTSVFTGGTVTVYRPNVKLTLQSIVTGPVIAVSPSSFTETLLPEASTTRNITVYNTGVASLNWNIASNRISFSLPGELNTGRTSVMERPLPSWVSVSPASGTVAAGGNVVLTLTLNATGLAESTYNYSLVINSNATNNPSLSIPITLTVYNPYPAGPRYVAEWEPSKGAVIRFPLGLPYAMITNMSQNDLLYVVVSTANQAGATNLLTVNGVNMANVRYIITDSDSYWVRDYGPLYVFEADNSLSIVDFTYNRPRPNDDAVPTAIADYLGIGHYDMSITHAGGNIMTDGMGKAMSTQLVLEENTSLTLSQVNEMFSYYLGVTDYQLYTDPNNTYIDHIDCWAKLLDVDKVMIRSVPTNHVQYSAIEAAVADWQSRISSYGTPYRIFRVYTPNDEPYTNAYFLNKKIYVPQMGTANDAAALSAYQNAMPGYTVLGMPLAILRLLTPFTAVPMLSLMSRWLL